MSGEKDGNKKGSGPSFAVKYIYPIIYWILWLFMRLYHWPRYRGTETLPEGPCVICGNHSGFADPIWIFQLLGPKNLPWTMAKKSVMDTPVLGPFLRTFQVFPVDRDNADLAAIKKALTVLRDGERLMIFPEGTRVKKGKKSEPKSGAVMLANRAGVPIVPIYISHNRKPFSRVRVVVGEAYTPEFSSRRPSGEELEQATKEMMEKVYALGQGK